MKQLWETILLIAAMMTFGSYNTIASKLMYQVACPTLPSGTHLFNKPWLTNMVMFLGESSMLIVYKLRQKAPRPDVPSSDPLLGDELSRSKTPPSYYFLLPASCDVIGTGIAAVALMFINAAVWQMLRGAIVIFSAALAVLFLKRRLYMYHWFGVVITVVGLSLIGLSAILEQSSTPPHTHSSDAGHTTLGVVLVVVAQVFSAFQMSFEEYLLTGYEVSSVQTVGMEGVWGILLMALLLLVMTNVPGSDHGVYESLPDSMHMVSGSRAIESLFSTYMLSIAIYNFVGMQISRKLSAVTRCLLDCMRTAVVWGFQLCLYYGVSTSYGTPWTQYSIFQLLGFCLLVLGTFVYNGLLHVPGLNYKRRLTDVPRRVLQATWSPTVNRASVWGRGPNFGPQSPGGSAANSPFPSPFDIGPQSPYQPTTVNTDAELDITGI
mmetsp:Transcript_89240/g.139700  ORF Transcript_89240/g.139700 Transcript_89240/m.139700 type:complete len:435 (+) Transcript_89240:62-1366(+)